MAEFDRREIDSIVNSLQTLAAATSRGKPWGGGSTPPPSYSASKASTSSSVLNSLHGQRHSMFGKTIEKATESVKLMHGSIDDFTHGLLGLSRLIPVILGGGIIEGLIRGATDLTRSYTKMADAGQMFGGSMFNMAAAAGESGLSLEQFTKLIEKHSETAAFLDKQTGASANTLGNLQKSVRSTLEPLGFLGMSMSQVTDATADFADSMRQSGLLGRMNNKNQQDAITDLLKDVSIFSELTGKSREAILKNVNDAYHEASEVALFNVSKLSEGQIAAHSKIVAFLASFPDGDKLSKFFTNLVGHEGQSWMTDMGKMFNQTVPMVNSEMERLRQKMLQGNVSDEDMVDFIQKAYHDIEPNVKNLNALGTAEAQGTLEFFNSVAPLAKMGRAELIQYMAHQRQLQAQNKVTEDFTKSLLLLESRFHVITGQFQVGFYGALETLTKSFMPDPDNKEAMEQFGIIMKSLGSIVGIVLGSFISAFTGINVTGMMGGITSLTDWLTRWNQPDMKTGMTGPQQLAKDVKVVLTNLWDAFVWLVKLLGGQEFRSAVTEIVDAIIAVGKFLGNFLHNGPMNNLLTGTTGMSQGTADVVQLGALYVGSKLLGGVIVSAVGSMLVSSVTGIAGAGAAVFAPVVGAAAGLLVPVLGTLLSALAMNAVSTYIGKGIVDHAASGVRKAIGAPDAAPGEKEGYDNALKNFSIFDRSTWEDPNASIWAAKPKRPNGPAAAGPRVTPSTPAPSAMPAITLPPVGGVGDPLSPENDPLFNLSSAIGSTQPGQPTLISAMSDLSDKMKDLNSLMSKNNDMTLTSLALQQKNNDLVSGGGTRLT